MQTQSAADTLTAKAIRLTVCKCRYKNLWGIFLHSYDGNKWRNTKGCIRVDPGNMEKVRNELKKDPNHQMPIYVNY